MADFVPCQLSFVAKGLLHKDVTVRVNALEESGLAARQVVWLVEGLYEPRPS